MDKKAAEHSKRIDLKEIKKKALRTAAGVTAAAGMLAGTLFAKPEELTKPDTAVPQAAIVYVEKEKEIPVEEAPEEKKEGHFARLRETLRNAVLKLPLWVRRVFILPLCAAGWGLMALGGLLWRAVGSPALAFAGKWILAAAVLFALVCLGLKLLFPDVKMKELINKSNAIAFAAACLLMALADPLCDRFLPDKCWLGPLVTVCVGACFVLFVAAPVVVRRLKTARTAEAA